MSDPEKLGRDILLIFFAEQLLQFSRGIELMLVRSRGARFYSAQTLDRDTGEILGKMPPLHSLLVGRNRSAGQPIPAMLQNRFDFFRRASFDLAFPDRQRSPPHLFEPFDGSPVALFVCTDFIQPKLGSRGREFEKPAVMPVPKAAVHEYRRPPLRKNQIRLSWQAPVMDKEAKAKAMEPSSDQHFRLGIFAPNAGHHPATHLRGDDISHRLLPSAGPAESRVPDILPAVHYWPAPQQDTAS